MTREDYVGDNIAEIVYSTYGSPYAQVRAAYPLHFFVNYLDPSMVSAGVLGGSAKPYTLNPKKTEPQPPKPEILKPACRHGRLGPANSRTSNP
eukprot:358552-Chlamydomonas_euryale.AAC.2